MSKPPFAHGEHRHPRSHVSPARADSLSLLQALPRPSRSPCPSLLKKKSSSTPRPMSWTLRPLPLCPPNLSTREASPWPSTTTLSRTPSEVPISLFSLCKRSSYSLCKREINVKKFSHSTHIRKRLGGKIRVIGQENGDTTLLREHTQTLLDLKLSSTSANSSNSSTTRSNSKSSRLASVSLDDTVRVWALDIGDGEIQ
jgi:hypothetical protein